LLMCPPVPESAAYFDPALSRALAKWIASREPCFEQEITDPEGVMRRYAIYELTSRLRVARTEALSGRPSPGPGGTAHNSQGLSASGTPGFDAARSRPREVPHVRPPTAGFSGGRRADIGGASRELVRIRMYQEFHPWLLTAAPPGPESTRTIGD
jgi:hypothetical protein